MLSLSKLTPCSMDYLVLYCPQQLIALLWLWRLICGRLAFYRARCLEFQVRRLCLQCNYLNRIYSSFTTPVGTVTVAQNINYVHSNYDFLNSIGGAFLGNSQSTNKFSGFPDTDNSCQTTSSVGPTIIPSNNSSRLRRDPLSLPSQDPVRGPNRVLPTYDGTEDLYWIVKCF